MVFHPQVARDSNPSSCRRRRNEMLCCGTDGILLGFGKAGSFSELAVNKQDGFFPFFFKGGVGLGFLLGCP